MTPRKQIFRNWDDYFIPGSFVLRNLFVSPGKPYGETDPEKLRRLEEFFTARAIAKLRRDPVEGSFDYEHLKEIHRRIFCEVYEWAGEERVGPDSFMTKNGHAYYPGGPALTAAAEAEFAKLSTMNHLRGLDHETFVTELAESWGELNVIHSFREGNTRTQFVFFTQLCEQAGYSIDTVKLSLDSSLRTAFVEARFHSQDTGSNSKLAEVLDRVVAPVSNSDYPR